jgi:hypothetical protein
VIDPALGNGQASATQCPPPGTDAALMLPCMPYSAKSADRKFIAAHSHG